MLNLKWAISYLLVFKNKSDIEVIELVKKGSTEAFSILYDRYVKLVYSICFDFVKNKERAEDLTHEIFLKLYSSIHSY